MDEPLPRRYPLTSRPAKSRSLLWIQLGIAAALFFGLTGVIIAYAVFKGVQSITPYSAAAWSTQNFGEFSIDAPYELHINKQLTQKAPPKSELYEFRDNPPEKQRLYVAVVRAKTQPNVPLDLVRSIREANNQFAKAVNDEAPKVESRPVTISGLDAQRGSYSAPSSKGSLMIESVSIREGSRHWHVVVVFYFPQMADDARRVIESVKIDRQGSRFSREEQAAVKKKVDADSPFGKDLPFVDQNATFTVLALMDLLADNDPERRFDAARHLWRENLAAPVVDCFIEQSYQEEIVRVLYILADVGIRAKRAEPVILELDKKQPGIAEQYANIKKQCIRGTNNWRWPQFHSLDHPEMAKVVTEFLGVGLFENGRWVRAVDGWYRIEGVLPEIDQFENSVNVLGEINGRGARGPFLPILLAAPKFGDVGLAVLDAGLYHCNPVTHRQVMDTLLQLGHEGMPVLERALDRPPIMTRLRAIDVLATIDGPDADSLLIRALASENAAVRCYSAYILGTRESRDPKIDTALKARQAATEPSETVQCTIATALQRRGTK